MGRGRSLRDFVPDGYGDGDEDRWRDDRGARSPADEDSAEYAAARAPVDLREYEARYDDTGYSEALPAYGETGYSEALPAYGGALVPLDESARLPALLDDETGPYVIPGAGEAMGNPFIRRRPRPLTMRIAIVSLITCLLVTGLVAMTPLGSSGASGLSSFQALSGEMVVNDSTGYFLYQAQHGDTTATVAAKFHVQEGGIYELNGLYAEQDLTTGEWYKIPTDTNYGWNYVPPSLATTAGGSSRLGNSPWTSIAGHCPAETTGGPAGNVNNPTSFQLHVPNPGAVWVRGFSWFHNGVDLAAPDGNPIHAAQTGQVIWAGWDVGGLGYSVKIDHCNGLATVYGHMQKLLVVAGEKVTVGDVIGLEGSTGWSTGPHCHFMVEVDNNPVDPMPYYGNSEYTITLNPAYK